jgi:hypothetical protein
LSSASHVTEFATLTQIAEITNDLE